MKSDAGEQRPPALWPYLLCCAVAACFIDLGTIHRDHNSDSLIPILVSLQKWTPYFWEQDRIGMLVPLIAAPVRDPFANLLLQTAIYVAAGLAAFFLLARYAIRDDRYPLIGLFSVIAFMLLTPQEYQNDLTFHTFYGVWLSLGLGGLILLEAPPGRAAIWRYLLAIVLLALAHWCYVAAIMLLLPLAMGRSLVCARGWNGFGAIVRSEGLRSAIALLIAFGVGRAIMRTSPYEPTKLGLLPVEDWPRSWGILVTHTWKANGPYWPLALLATSVLALLIFRKQCKQRSICESYRIGLIMFIVGAAHISLMATFWWVAHNSQWDRYSKPGIFLIQGGLSIFAMSALSALLSPKWHRLGPLIALPALLLAAWATSGVPSIHGVRADLDAGLGKDTDEVLTFHGTHIAGNYWHVWPAVFHANMVLHERGDDRTIWGVTLRSDPTRRLWEPLDPG